MTVYLDTLVVVNIYISWLTISLASKILNLACNKKRRAAASVLGGFSSLIILIYSESAVVVILSALLKLVSLLLMTFAAFYKKGMNLKRLATSALAFVIINIAFGGGVYLLQSIFKTRVIYINSFTFYFDISLTKLIFITGTVYIVICLVSYIASNKLDKSHSYRVLMTIDDCSYHIDGVSDTGNTVTDIFSGKPVVICTGFGDKAAHGRKITAVPYSTVNGEGILYAFTPDKLCIEDEKGSIKEVSALVAFTDGNSKRAVFNPKVLM